MLDLMKQLVIYGTGYLDVIKLIDAINRICPTYKIAGFINDLPEFQGKSFMDYPVLGAKDVIPKLVREGNHCFFNNITSTLENRKSIAATLEKNDCEIVSLVHPSVDMSYVQIGEGCIIPDGCAVGSNTKIGRYLTCRLHSVISHNVTIKDFAYIGPGATVSGGSVLEEGCFIGAGATIMHGVVIGAGAIIGAGSTVISDIPGRVVAYGVPAKVVKEDIGEDYRGRGM